MMNKQTKLIITGVVALGVIFAGGFAGFNAYKSNKINQIVSRGINYMDNKDYSNALAMYDLALSEGHSDKAQELKTDITNLQNAEQKYNEGNLQASLNDLDQIKDYKNYKGFTGAVDSLRNKIVDAEKASKEIDTDISQVRDSIKNNKYQDAENTLEKLSKVKLNDSQKQQTSDLSKVVNSELQKQEADKQKAEAEKKAKEQQEVKKQESANKAPATNNDGVVSGPRTEGGYTYPLTQDECLKLLKDTLPGGFGYFGRTGVDGSVVYEFTHNVNGANGPHVLVNTDTGEITDEDNNVLAYAPTN